MDEVDMTYQAYNTPFPLILATLPLDTGKVLHELTVCGKQSRAYSGYSSTSCCTMSLG